MNSLKKSTVFADKFDGSSTSMKEQGRHDRLYVSLLARSMTNMYAPQMSQNYARIMEAESQEMFELKVGRS